VTTPHPQTIKERRKFKKLQVRSCCNETCFYVYSVTFKVQVFCDFTIYYNSQYFIVLDCKLFKLNSSAVVVPTICQKPRNLKVLELSPDLDTLAVA